MKKLSNIGLAAISFFGLLPSIAMAQINNDDVNTNNINIPRTGNIKDWIVIAGNWVFGLGFALAVLFLIVGGVRYVISSGNEEQVEKARHTIFNAVIGIIVMLLALIILNTVKAFFGAK